ITGKSFDDLFVTHSHLGWCCTLEHFNGLGTDFAYGSAGNQFNGVPAWFVPPDGAYAFVGRRLTLLRGFMDKVDKVIEGTAMWGASTEELFVVGASGIIWRRVK